MADFEHGGRLPVHVHFVMDEFANGTQLLDDYIGQGHKGRMMNVLLRIYDSEIWNLQVEKGIKLWYNAL